MMLENILYESKKISQDFFKYRGKEISSKLGDGLLMIQSSMPETLFNHYLINGHLKELETWPWYDERMSLKYWFENSTTFFVDNEFITLASNVPINNKILKNLENAKLIENMYNI